MPVHHWTHLDRWQLDVTSLTAMSDLLPHFDGSPTNLSWLQHSLSGGSDHHGGGDNGDTSVDSGDDNVLVRLWQW